MREREREINREMERVKRRIHFYPDFGGCVRINTHSHAHIHVAKLFNLWTCFANDVNGSMQVVNVCYCLFRTSYDNSTLLFHAVHAPCTASFTNENGCFFSSRKTSEWNKNQQIFKLNEIERIDWKLNQTKPPLIVRGENSSENVTNIKQSIFALVVSGFEFVETKYWVNSFECNTNMIRNWEAV